MIEREKYTVRLLKFINKSLPKYNQVLILGNSNIESNTIEVANYITSNYGFPVFFVVSRKYKKYAQNLLLPNAKVIHKSTFIYLYKYLTSKYIFFTHRNVVDKQFHNQITVNIGHGILYKRVKKLRGLPGISADITVGTSALTKKMFSEAFGVLEESVFISGYPRNDVMIRSKTNKKEIKEKLLQNLNSFDKVLLWLPTFRDRAGNREKASDGKSFNNPFNIENFDSISFNELLKQHNAICILKPHPVAAKFSEIRNLSNLIFVDDEWICSKGFTLYDLIGCSDILISDFSSVIIDYLLLDQPIICFSSDLKEYTETRGFYFDDIENWLPSKVLDTQKDLFDSIEFLLLNNEDPNQIKQRKLKDLFFSYYDDNSTSRLVKHVFDDKQNSFVK